MNEPMGPEHANEDAPLARRPSRRTAFLLGLGVFVSPAFVATAPLLGAARGGIIYQACGVVSMFGIWLMIAAFRRSR